MKKLFPLSFVFSLFSFVFFFSCGGDDNPDPEPNPSTTHTININGNGNEGAIATLFLNGQVDGDKTGANGSTTLSHIDKNTTTTYDSITVEKDGYTRWVKKRPSVGTSATYTYSINEITGKTANATFKLTDKITKKTIENLLVRYNNVDTPIDSTFSLSQVPLGEYNLTFKKSDSTWMMIPDITKQANLVEGDNVFVYEVDATKKQFFANLGVTTKDSDDNAIQGATLSANNKTATTGTNGAATIASVKEIPALAATPWKGGTTTLIYDLSKEGFQDFDAQTVTIKEGDNNYNHTLAKDAEKTANATFKLIDDVTKETIENLLVTYNGTTTPIDETFTLSDVPVGEYNLTFKKSDSTWMIIPDITKQASLVEGDNVFVYEVDATKKQFFADLTLVVDDQDNQDLEGVILSANNKTATTGTNGAATIASVKEVPAQTVKPWLSGTTTTTYDLSKDGYEDFGAKTVNLVEGSNAYSEKLEKKVASSTESGDIALVMRLKGTAENGTVTIATNMQVPDSTYTVTATNNVPVFWNIHVADGNNPTQYKFETTDTDTDGRFVKTIRYIDVHQDVNGEVNGSQIINLDEIPNEVDISTTIFNSRNLNRVSGQTVYLVRDDNNTTVDTQVTNGSGEILFDNVPGNIVYHLVNEGANTYKKTNGSFKTANVIKMSQTELQINAATINILQDINGDDIPGSIMQLYKPLAENTETVQHMYFPPANQRQLAVDQSAEFADLLGVTIVPTDTPFPSNPTATQISEYHPGPYDKNKDTNVFGINITSYSGTGAFTNGKTLPNGNQITFYGSVNLGGLDTRLNHHEWGNLYNFPWLNGNDTTFKTSRESSAGQIYSLQDATYDIPVMSEWILTTTNQYDAKDSNNIPIEYNKTTKIE